MKNEKYEEVEVKIVKVASREQQGIISSLTKELKKERAKGEEKKINTIQAKKFVSPKELSEILPNMSISQQQTYRGRLKDRIPYIQQKAGGKITYEVEAVKQWMDGNNISR